MWWGGVGEGWHHHTAIPTFGFRKERKTPGWVRFITELEVDCCKAPLMYSLTLGINSLRGNGRRGFATPVPPLRLRFLLILYNELWPRMEDGRRSVMNTQWVVSRNHQYVLGTLYDSLEWSLWFLNRCSAPDTSGRSFLVVSQMWRCNNLLHVTRLTINVELLRQ